VKGKLIIIIIMYLLTAIGLSPSGSGYFTCKQNVKLVTNKFKSGGLHENHVVAGDRERDRPREKVWETRMELNAVGRMDDFGKRERKGG